MEFSQPKDLHNIVQCNKLLFKLLSTSMVVKNILRSEGRGFQSMKNLYPLMKKNAIYPLKPFRLLTLCIGKKCEYCGNITHDKALFENKGISVGETRFVRGNFGSLICWACLKYERDRYHDAPPKCKRFTNLTSKFEKIKWNCSCDTYRYKMFYNNIYLSSRMILYKIFEHPKVLAYPYGSRYLQRGIDNELIPLLHNAWGNEPGLANRQLGPIVESQDRFEIMWARTHVNSFGDPEGPRVTRSILHDIVDYLKSDENHTIDGYLDEKIHWTVNDRDYDEFISSYEEQIEQAENLQEQRREDLKIKSALRRFNKIDSAMKLIDKIIRHMNKTNIKRWTKEMNDNQDMSENHQESDFMRWSGIRPIADSKRLRLVMIRALLMYREIPYEKGTWLLTYDTGTPKLDRTIHQALEPHLRNPKTLLPFESRNLAKKVFFQCKKIITLEKCKGLYTYHWGIRRSFQERYRNEYQPIRTIQPSIEWKDTSENRLP